MAATKASPEKPTVEVLAAELNRHVLGCERGGRAARAATEANTKAVEALSEAVDKAVKAFDARANALDRKIDKGWRDFNRRSWILVGAIATIIFTGVVTVVTNDLSLHSSVASKSDVATASAARNDEDAKLTAISNQLSGLRKSQ